MSYEIDFVSVKKDKCSKNADAIAIRWNAGTDNNPEYHIGVVDGGYAVHGEALRDHMNEYYFDDSGNIKDRDDKVIDFVLNTHPDQDHIEGLKTVIKEFNVQALYMNRPWQHLDELYDRVKDGRITKDSLERRLREKFSYLDDLETTANECGVPIYDVFQGDEIADGFLILSPSEDFYLDMLAASEKTPDMEVEEARSLLEKFANKAKTVIESWTDELLREDVTTSPVNETSAILRGIVDGEGFLLTGDAGKQALTEAMDYLDNQGEDIKDTVSCYEMPHHGGRHNVTPSVLNRMIGNKVAKGVTTGKEAFASVAQDCDHPKKMVVNAYLRRGVKVYKTRGIVLCHHRGNMPSRGWSTAPQEDFSDEVETWE